MCRIYSKKLSDQTYRSVNSTTKQSFIKSSIKQIVLGPSWSWSYGSWIYNYLCNQCLSLLKLLVRIPLRWGVLDTTFCDKTCQWLATGRWFSLDTMFSSTNKTDCHNITEILLRVTLNTINQAYRIKYKNKYYWYSIFIIQSYKDESYSYFWLTTW